MPEVIAGMEKLEQVAKELNINPNIAGLYPVTAEATREAFQAWAVECELIVSPEDSEAVRAIRKGYTPTIFSESRRVRL